MDSSGTVVRIAQPGVLTASLGRSSGSSGWLVSPRYDLTWFLPVAAFIPVHVAFIAVGRRAALDSALATPSFVLFFSIISISHLVSPVMTAWSIPGLRAAMLKKKRRYLLVPALSWAIFVPMGVAAAWCARHVPGLVITHPWYWLVLAMTLVDIQHFGGQHFGFLSIYRRTSGMAANHDRQLDKVFAYAMGLLAVTAWIFFQRAPIGVLANHIPGLSLAPLIGTMVTGIAAFLAGGRLALDLRSGNATLPRVLYVLLLGVVVSLCGLNLIDGVLIMAVWHWLGALGLSMKLLATSRQREAANRPTLWAKITSRGWSILLCFAALGPLLVIPLLEMLPKALWGAPGDLLVDGPAPISLWYGFIAGLMSSVRATHVLYDRFLYSFQKPEIREHVAPNLFEPPPC